MAEEQKTSTEPTTQEEQQTATQEPAQTEEKTPTVQELMVEIAKLKRSSEKNAAEAADYKRRYKETLSTQEQASMEKAEAEARRDDEFKALQRKDQIHDLTENFMDLGYDKDDAKKAATAQADGDTQTLFKIQADVLAKKQKAIEAEFYKNRPQPNAGVGGEKPNITKDDFQKLMSKGNYLDVLRFKQLYPQTYAEYTKK